MIVVDASVIIDALTARGTETLRSFLATQDLHAPSLLDYEVLSGLRGLVLGGRLSSTRALDALTDFDALTIRRWHFADELRRRAFALRETVSAYDAAYVALAEALGCALVTRDARLTRSVGHGVPIEVL